MTLDNELRAAFDSIDIVCFDIVIVVLFITLCDWFVVGVLTTLQDGNGVLSADELRDAMRRLGLPPLVVHDGIDFASFKELVEARRGELRAQFDELDTDGCVWRV